MRKILYILLACSLLSSSTPLLMAGNCSCLELANEEMNDAYSTGCGCEDGIYNCVSNSMLGWGIALTIGIALLTGFISQSATAHVPSTTTSSSD